MADLKRYTQSSFVSALSFYTKEELTLLSDMVKAKMSLRTPGIHFMSFYGMVQEALSVDPSSFQQALDYNDEPFLTERYSYFFDQLQNIPLLMSHPDPLVQLAVKWRFSIGH